MKNMMLVFGTRPEAIKMSPLVKEFQKYPEKFETIVCVTGQHREMLDQVLRIFDIQPDYDLNIMKQGQDLYDVTARVLTGMRDVLKETRPDIGYDYFHGSGIGRFLSADSCGAYRGRTSDTQYLQSMAGGNEPTDYRTYCYLSFCTDFTE